MNYYTHPGHWVLLQPANTLADMAKCVADAPIKGFIKRYQWGEFDLGWLKGDLDDCAGMGVYLIPMIVDKTFSGNENPMPAGMEHLAQLNIQNGMTALRWHPDVISEFTNLHGEIRNTFGSHLAFEGIATQETSLGLADDVLTKYNYSVSAYQSHYTNLFDFNETRNGFRRVFWFMNYVVKGQKNIDEWIYDWRDSGLDQNYVLGGPDTIPTDLKLLANVYPNYTLHQPNFAGISIPSYASASIQQLDNFATGTLRASYKFWVYSKANWADVAAYIKANP